MSRTRARPKAAVVAVVASGLLVSGCTGGNAAQNGPDAEDNRFIAGDGSAKVVQVADRTGVLQVEGSTLDDKPFKLTDLKGKIVVVNFWASWCAPCRGEAPTLERLYQEKKSKGVEFLGVDIKDGKDLAKAFERKFKITYASLFDKDGRLTLAFKDVPPNAVPSTLVLDRQGRVAARIVGAITYSKLNPLIEQIAAEK